MSAAKKAKDMTKKDAIYSCAKELFSEKGFKNTNVPDITEKAGIATGTFYLYYVSKEQLFMEIFLEENQKLKVSIMTDLDTDREPLQVIQEMMELNMRGMLENPILREWYNKEVFSKIEEKYREMNGIEKIDFTYDVYSQMVRKWQEEGRIRNDFSCEMIMAMFHAVIIIDEHKDEIGIQFFPQVQSYLTDFIMEGLKP
jgi:AcrR family transcriptional regulator